MKKTLLIAAFALMGAGTTMAFEGGEYVYTLSQRLKVSDGTNLFTNGDFTDLLNGWTDAAGESANSDNWAVEPGAGPEGENTLKSLSANGVLCRSFMLDPGTYLVSYQIKGVAASVLFTGSQGDASVNTYSNNTVDIFVNANGSLEREFFDDANFGTTVSANRYIDDTWKTINFLATIDEGQTLVFHLEKMAADTEFTNFTIVAADEVYDDRALNAKVAHVKNLMEMPEFNIEEAADAKAALQEAIETIEGAMAAGATDDPGTGESMAEALNEPLEAFLAVSSVNLAIEDIFKYSSDITTFPKYNRGNISNNQAIGGFKFHGDNWIHAQGADNFAKQIQAGGSYQVGPGSVSFYNKYLPAGKYYISAEVMNAFCNKDYTLLYNQEHAISAYVGWNDDPATFTFLDNISGEEFKRVTFIADFDGQSEFEAGFWWDGPADAGRFEIRNLEIRTFNGDVIDQATHAKTFEAFKAQYDAAVERHNNVVAMQSDPNYPWDQGVLAAARAKYDPYYFDIINMGWVTADGKDSGVATTEQLEDWRLYQGIEEYGEVNEETGEAPRLEYQLVRGYDAAINTVKATNKPFFDLATAIDEAKSTRNLGGNASGDRETYKAAILKAIATIKNVRANTTDATREADTETLNNALSEMNTATEAFLASVSLRPFVDIDFSQAAEETEDGWVINGAAGSILLSNYEADNYTGTTSLQQGWQGENNEVLRVGNGNATVTLAEENIPNDEENFRASFDVYFGKLVGKLLTVELQNAAGQRIAGFSYDCYNNSVSYNDFNDDANTGMDIKGYATGIGSGSASNNAICVANNLSSFDLVIDYKNATVQGTLKNAQKGTCEGKAIALNNTLEDNKVAKFVVSSNYNNQDRRCWFDNLKLYKYQLGDMAEDILEDGWPEVDGIATIAAERQANGAIYTISGVRVNGNAVQKGIYIQNGRKFIVK